MIVGTRGETEEYFGQAYEFIKSLDVTQLHVFSYSERPGTQALKIDHVVAPEEKHRRSQQLLELSDEKTRAFYARHIGQTMPVLLERPKPGLPMHGFTPNYIRVEVLMMLPWTTSSCLCAWAISMPTAPHSWEQWNKECRLCNK